MLGAMHDDSANLTAAEAGAKGGTARARRLTKTQRAEIARAAAAARWGTAIPIATHTGDLTIGDVRIPCAVLDNQTRVLSENGITNAILGTRSGASKRLKTAGALLPIFAAPRQLKPFISDDLLNGPLKPVTYVSGDRTVVGYDANILPAICEVWLTAREHGALQRQQLDKAQKAEILLRGLARLGITALVDEATGYQDARARDALAKILEAFVAKELRKWVRTFPPEYYKEICRLRNWPFPDATQGQQQRTPFIGKITNDVVYARLAPGVRTELHRVTPRDDKGRLRHKLFQRLTEGVGHPKLLEHLAKVVTVMQLSPDWATFMANMNRLMPVYKDLPPLLQLLERDE